jgi:cell division septum initiation protein DivIVA
MTDIDQLLSVYSPGEPSMKPDVLKQIKEIEKERAKMTPNTIMMNEPGKPPRPLSNDEVIALINFQTEQLKVLTSKNEDLENMVANLQKTIAQMNQKSAESSLDSLSPTIAPVSGPGPVPEFVDTLLEKIKDLENKLEKMELEKSSVREPVVPPTPSPSPSPSPSIPIIKSKSTPEVFVNIL